MYRIYTKQFGVLKKHARKFLFLMRLTTAILIISMLQVSAATLAQKLTYAQQNATLTQVFKVIKSQTGYNVVWYEGDLDASRTTINANFKKTPLDEVMQQILSGLPLTYETSKQTIIIKAKPMSSSSPAGGILNKINVHGIVTDEKGNPLPGATIRAKGTDVATVTNANGEFDLKGVNDNATLTIFYVGYEPKEIIASSNVGKIALTVATSKLDEVKINAGYYSVTDRERTGSISKITAASIENQPISNPLQALQGRVAGLQISQLTGVPGGGFAVQIRGQNSISSGNDPLYIIDGVIYPSSNLNNANSSAVTKGVNPLSMISPDNIESIEVLKDADATAIYGSRGANGVILISTKKAPIGQTTINALISRGYSQVGHKLDLMNTEQYLSMRMEALKNDGLAPSSTDYDVNGTWDKNKYTDWQDKLIGGNASITNASLSISGGNQGMSYLISSSYYQEGSVFPGNFGFKRGGLNSNLTFGSLNSRLSATLTTGYSRSTSNLLQADPTLYITAAPNAPDAYDQYGNLSWSYKNIAMTGNPMAPLYNTLDAFTDNLIGNLTLNFKILKNLVFKTSIGYNSIKRNELSKYPNISLSPSYNPGPADRESQFGNDYNNSWIAEPQLTYDAKLGPGNLSALIGMSFQENIAENRNIKASGFNSDDLMGNISSASAFSISESSYAQYKYSALFGRLNYSLSDKYYLNLTARRDGSSRFGPGRQFANFGAIGAAWIFSEEEVIKNNLSFVSFGKLRASYGITGNDQISNYGYLQLFDSSGTYQGTPTLNTTRIANPDFGWETNVKMEVALQVGLLKEKINLQAAYFRNRSSNQLVAIPLPSSVGTTAFIGNLPATVQNTGWEFEGNLKLLNRTDWKWSAGFNLTIPRNKLVNYPGLATSTNSTTLIVGQPLSIRRYYNITVNPQTGLYQFEDKDNNGVQNDADKYLNQFIGQRLYGGFSNSVSYKHFNLDLLLSFTKQTGNSLLYGITYPPGYFVGSNPNQNQPVAITSDHWENAGDQTANIKFTTTGAGLTNFQLAKNGSQSISDASFIRLKNISLSYSLPNEWLSIIKVKAAQLTIQGQNVLTFTKYAGLDPESQLGSLPPLRTFLLGIKLTL